MNTDSDHTESSTGNISRVSGQVAVGSNIAQASGDSSTYIDTSQSVFEQQGQQIGSHQYNAGGNINLYYQEQTVRKLVETVSTFDGYIERTKEEKELSRLLIDSNGSEPVLLSGMSGIGKTWLAHQVIHTLQQTPPPVFPGKILWGSLADLEPHQLLYQCLDLLGHTTYHSASSTDTPRRLFWNRVDQCTERMLVVFDDVRHEQQLAKILPDNQELLNCCILIICTQQPQIITTSRKMHLKGFSEKDEVCKLFRHHLDLDDRRMAFYEQHLEEIAQRLGWLPLLLSTAARDMASGNISPSSYATSLREQDNPGIRLGRSIVDGLELALRDLSDEQRDLFTFIGVLGEGSWRLDMLAAVVIRRPADIQRDLDMLVKRGLVQSREGRYQVNVIVREFAQQLLHKQPPYVRHAAYTCLAHECLTHARRLAQSLIERPDMRAIVERGTPYYNDYFVREYNMLISLESSHIQQVIEWAIQHEEWPLLLQFADVSYSELLLYFIASVFDEIRMSFSLAILVEPIVWQQGATQPLPYQTLVSTSGRHSIPLRKDAERVVQAASPTRRELELNIQAGRIIDGLFEDVCFLDTRWVGVRAVGLICREVELIGCAFIACDFSQSVWVGGDARQLSLTGSILRYALLHNIRLYAANLRDGDLSGAVLEKVELRGADLRNCNLTGVLFDHVDLRGADLRGSCVDHAIFHEVRFQGCRIDGVDLTTAFFAGDPASLAWDHAEHNEIMLAMKPDAWRRGTEAFLKHPRIVAQNKLSSIDEANKRGDPGKIDSDFTGADLRAVAYNDLLVSDCLFRKTDFRAARFEPIRPERDASEQNELEGANFSRANLHGANLRRVHLEGITFQRANMRGIDLRTAVLKDVNLEEADLTDAELRCAIIQKGQLQAARLRNARLRNASLAHAQLQNAELTDVDMSYANLEMAQLQNTKLNKANLRGSRLVGANLNGADLSGANCDEADFTGATLADEILARAASWRGATLTDGKFVQVIDNNKKPVLFPAEHNRLRLAYLVGTFTDLHLDDYDMIGAQLTGDFGSASFIRTRLDHGRLQGAFSSVSFQQASLRHASLSGNFTATQFDEAVFTDVQLSGIFARCSFQAIDLRKTTCEGASLVGCNFSKSQADESFFRHAFRLRGCILPDGTRYDGSFDLAGDKEDAKNYNYNLTDSGDRAVFFGAEKLRIRFS